MRRGEDRGTTQTSIRKEFQEVDMNGTRVLGVAAIGAFLVAAAPVQPAQAVSLINPGAAGTIQEDSRQFTTEVHWHHHWHRGWHHRHWGWRHRHWGWHHRRWHHRHWRHW
jgi:hypothetical protein